MHGIYYFQRRFPAKLQPSAVHSKAHRFIGPGNAVGHVVDALALVHKALYAIDDPGII